MTATVLIYALVRLCVQACVSDKALFTSPGGGGASLLQRPIHHNASAIYKIDDQRLCRSAHNDAADAHRGTSTHNRRQGEAKQTEAIVYKQKAEKKIVQRDERESD